MAFSYYQPNPKNKSTGDCVIRAVSKAFNVSWETAYIDLVMQGYLMGDLPSSNAVLNSYLRSKGFRRHAVPNTCPDCYSFADFAYEHPRGTYVLGTGTHVACVKDGNIYDSWDSSDSVVIYYYEREKS